MLLDTKVTGFKPEDMNPILWKIEEYVQGIVRFWQLCIRKEGGQTSGLISRYVIPPLLITPNPRSSYLITIFVSLSFHR